jgi:hypothetical protein
MTDRNGQRIRLVTLRQGFQCEDNPDHMLDLLFRSATVADNRLLDRARRVFKKLRLTGKRRANRCCAGMPEFQRAIRILVHEHLFYRNMAWRIFRYQVADA